MQVGLQGVDAIKHMHAQGVTAQVHCQLRSHLLAGDDCEHVLAPAAHHEHCTKVLCLLM